MATEGIPGGRVPGTPRPATPDMSEQPAGGPHYSMSPLLRNQIGTLSKQCSYGVQHFLLHNVQKILEESCFEFATKNAPNFLGKTGWKTPEAGELTEWSKQFPRSIEVQRLKNANWVGELDRTLRVLCQVRHIAVHRRPISVRSLVGLLQSAVNLGKILRDEERTKKLQKVLSHIEDFQNTLEQQARLLEEDLEDEIYSLQKRKDGLNREKLEINNKASAAIHKVCRNNTELIAIAEKRTKALIEGVFESVKKEEDDREPNLQGVPQRPQEGPVIGRKFEIIDLTGDDNNATSAARATSGPHTRTSLLRQAKELTPFGCKSQSNVEASVTYSTKRVAPETDQVGVGLKKQRDRLTPESQRSASMDIGGHECGKIIAVSTEGPAN